MARPRKIDWDAVRHDWESSAELTNADLARKYGVHLSAIGKRARGDGWAERPAIAAPVSPALLPPDPACPQPPFHAGNPVGSALTAPDHDAPPDIISVEATEWSIVEVHTADDTSCIYRDLTEQHQSEVLMAEKFRVAALSTVHAALKSGQLTDWKIARMATLALDGQLRALDKKQQMEIRAWRLGKNQI